jgi:hemin uptake protein HemP
MEEEKNGMRQLPDTPAERLRYDRAARRLNSRALLGTAKVLIIEHDGREYRLRLTQNGKLILTA